MGRLVQSRGDNGGITAKCNVGSQVAPGTEKGQEWKTTDEVQIRPADELIISYHG